MYKIAFIDIDNTILDHNIGDFDHLSLKAIKDAKEKGMIIYLCTARNYFATIKTGIIDLIDPDGFICSNGNIIRTKEKVLFANIVPTNIAKQVEKVLNKHHLMSQFSSPFGSHLTNIPNKYFYKYFEIYKEATPEIVKYDNENITSMLVFAPKKFDDILQKELPKEIEFRRYHEYGLDLGYNFKSKGDGAKKVLKILNIKKEESIGIGDSYDDIALFKAVGLGVAMGNSLVEIKNNADLVIDSISDHGVANFFNKLFINN